MNSLGLPWILPPLSDNHIPAAVHRSFNARSLATPIQISQLRILYGAGKMPKELLARLDSRHKEALTEEQADQLILELQEAMNSWPWKQPAEASAPVSATPTHFEASGEKRPAGFVPNPNLLATCEQRDRMMELLRIVMLERKRKTKHLLNLLNYNQVRAEEVINELAEWVAYCESGDPAAA